MRLGIAGAWVESLRTTPVSSAFAVITVSIAVARGSLPPRWHHRLMAAAMYRGRDLSHGNIWPLLPSAFLVHSVLDLVWTIMLMLSLFTALERRVGSRGVLLITLGSHLFSTVIIDALAFDHHWQAWLTQRDFGTSCLIMGAAAAMTVATQNRFLATGLLLIFTVDVTVNSPMTIAEHLVAVGTGALAYTVLAVMPTVIRPAAYLDAYPVIESH